jgi:hypothetical protein
MKKNKTNSSTSTGAPTDPKEKNQHDEATEGSIRSVSDPEAYDDDYESGQEDEIIEEEGRTEKDNRPGKS